MANIYIVYILKQVRLTRNHVKGIGQTDNYQHIVLDMVEMEIWNLTYKVTNDDIGIGAMYTSTPLYMFGILHCRYRFRIYILYVHEH